MVAKNSRDVLRKAIAKLRNASRAGGPAPGTALPRRDSYVNAIGEARSTLGVDTFHEFLDAVGRIPGVRDRLLENTFPQSALPLYRYTATPAGSLRRELAWAGAYLSRFQVQLGAFARASASFQSALLRSEWQAATAELEQIQSEFGWSVWLISQRLTLVQRTLGLEAQKRLAEDIKTSARAGSVTAYITHYLSNRVEQTVDAIRFWDRMNERIHQLASNVEVKAIIRHHLLPGAQQTDVDLASILVSGSNGSVIDYYESVLSVVRSIIGSESSDGQTAARRLLSTLMIGDPRWMWLQKLEGVDITPPPTDSARIVAGYLRLGVLIEPAAAEGFYEYLETAARMGRQDSGLSSFSLELRDSIAAVLRRPGESADERAHLFGLSLNHAGQVWADRLSCLLAEHDVVAPAPLRDSARVAARLCGLAGLGPYVLERSMRGELGERHLRLLSEGSPDGSDCAAYLSSTRTDQTGHRTELRELQPAFDAFRGLAISAARGEIETVIRLSRDLLEAEDPVLRTGASRVRILSQLASHQLGNALRDAIRLAIQHAELLFAMPLEEIARQVTPENFDDLSSAIELPILYDLLVRIIGADYEAERAYAVERFLLTHSVAQPSALPIEPDEKSLLRWEQLHFLRFCCAESVFNRVQLFTSVDEVIAERLQILSRLASADIPNAREYEDEIKTLQRRIQIEQRMREIERSKIYVDVDAVRVEANKQLSGAYRRFIQLSVAELQEPGLKEIAVEQALEGLLAGDAQALSALALPSSESFEAFKAFVTDLRDLYTSGDLFGLDTYLSQRIRHGTFAATLRSALDRFGLISALDPATNEYGHDTKWTRQLPVELGRQAGVRIAAFSREFDLLIGGVLRQWIQIRLRPEEQGLFDFVFPDAVLRLVQEWFTVERSFADALNYLLTLFTVRLRGSLESIRHRLSDEIKSTAVRLMVELETELNGLCRNHECAHALRDVSTARTELQAAFDRVAQWFNLSEEIATEPFNMQDALDVSIASVKTLYPSFSVDVETQGDLPTVQQGLFFNSYVDILFIILENAATKSGLGQNARCVIGIASDGGAVVIVAINPVSPEMATTERREALDRKRQDIAAKRYAGASRKEGGSGLFKICRIMTHEFGMEPVIEAAYSEDDDQQTSFEISLTLPVDIIQPAAAK